MSFLAEVELVVAAAPERAFDRMADYASWSEWMPSTFRPAGSRPATTALRTGDTFDVRIAGLPVPMRLQVSVARRPAEIAWTGGIPGVLHAEHRFLFEETPEGGTRVRSVESWAGPLARALRPAVQPRAVRIGAQQLAGLAHALHAK